MKRKSLTLLIANVSSIIGALVGLFVFDLLSKESYQFIHFIASMFIAMLVGYLIFKVAELILNQDKK